MKIKLLAGLALSGIIFFVVLLFSDVTMTFFYPHLLLTFEFTRQMRPYAILGGSYSGLALACSSFIPLLQMRQRSSKKKFREHLKRQAGMLFTILLVSAGIGWMTYYMIIDIPASILHRHAAKETVEFEAWATLAAPARDLQGDCTHHILFHEPRISTSIQYACLTWGQWQSLRDLDFPVTVTLYGKKSYYGYELRYRK